MGSLDHSAVKSDIAAVCLPNHAVKVEQWQKNSVFTIKKKAKFQAAEVTATVEPKKQRIQQDKVTNHSAELPVPLITFLDHYLGGFLNMGPPVVTMD